MKYVGLALLLASGCAFHVNGDNGGGVDMSLPVDDLGGGSGGSGGGDLALPADDLATPNDIAGVPIVCTAGSSSCNGSTLVTCPDGTAQMMTTCALGCSSSGGAHCEVLYPRAPVSRSDFDTAGLSAVTISVGGGIGTDNGQINAGTAIFRPANINPNTYEVHNGIGFHVVTIPGQSGKMGIFTFKSLTVAQGQALNAYGASALALVSAGDMTIDGVVDVTCAGNVFVAGGGPMAKPYAAGPGGGNGGQPGLNSGVAVQPGGGGAGADNMHLAGGGGGAFGDVGGAGGGQMTNVGGAGGAAYGDAMLTVLVGGSGGGAGGQGPMPTMNASFGGGGGGVALLVAQGTLTLGAGTALGGVNAGGCGGTAANIVGGGGGGAGGAILLQAIAVHIAAMGGVAANGGGGSASNSNGMMANGKAGAIATAAAAGGTSGTGGGLGGGATGANGGAGGVAGTAAQPGDASDAGGGGGGGSVGRIRIESQAGSATLDTGAIASPTPAQGMVDIH